MARGRTWLATLGVAGLVALAVACGGGGGGDSTKVNQSQAASMADKFFFNLFGIFTGETEAKEFIEMFTPECREGVDEEEVEEALAFISGFGGAFGDFDDINISEFDVGEVTLEETDEGTLVAPKSLQAIRAKVDGKFVNADQYLQGVGFDAFGSEDPSGEQILMVRQDGKTYIADCSFLQEFTAG
jgi:hypothetical protein